MLFLIYLSALTSLLILPAQEALFARSSTHTKALSSTIRSIRIDIERGNFIGALELLASIPAADIDHNPELLTLRGIAHWGEGLRKCGPLSSITIEVDMVRRVSHFLRSESERLQNSPEWLKQLEAATTSIAGDYAQCQMNARALPKAFLEVDILLGRAESDFSAASRLSPRSHAEWCVAPEGWQLLVLVHQFILLQERSRWIKPKAMKSRYTDDLEISLPIPTGAALADLEKRIHESIAGLLSRGDAVPNVAAIAHCIADSTILTAAAARGLGDWPKQSTIARIGSPHASSVERAEIAVSHKQLSRLDDALATSRSDPLGTAVSLYMFSFSRITSPAKDGPLYSAIAILHTTSRKIAGDMLNKVDLGHGMRALVHLERARTANLVQGNEINALAEIVQACNRKPLRRPILNAAPGPIREVFLRASGLLMKDIGYQVGSGFDQLSKLLDDLIKAAPTPELKARYCFVRVRLGNLLTTSDLPWDRILGYQQISAALVQLNNLSGSLTGSQQATLAVLEKQTGQQAMDESFPPSTLAIVDGKVIWVRDPFSGQRTMLRNPLVTVSQRGFMMSAIPGPK